MKLILTFLLLTIFSPLNPLFSQCNALHFDGNNDYVQANSPFTGDTDFTVEMWFKSENTLNGACDNTSLADFRWLISWDDNDFGIGDCNGDLRFVFRPLCPIGTALCSNLPPSDISDGNWHHVAYTKSSTAGTRIYVDGSFLVNFGSDFYDMSGFFRLGRSGTGNVGKNWKGSIDEVRIWNYARSETEIQDVYNCGLTGTEPGLVTYYNANQGIANGSNSSVTTINDATSNANNGTLSNFMLSGSTSNWVSGYQAVCTSCPSLQGQCNGLHFDGTDDYVEFTSPFNGNSDFTVEMWFKSESTLNGACDNTSLADFRWLISWDDNDFGIGDCNGDLRFVFRPLCPIGTALCSNLPPFDVSDGNWHHVAYTKNSTETRIYIDGAFFINFGADVYDLSGLFRLGRSGTGNVGKNWEGVVDEVRIWDKARTLSEIQADYQCLLNGNEANLVAYYPANQGAANGNNPGVFVLPDQSINSNNGTLNNFALSGNNSNWTGGYHNINNSCGNCTISSIYELHDSRFKVYPNPSNQFLNIEIVSQDEQMGYSLQLINQTGRIILTDDMEKGMDLKMLSVENLPGGIYFLLIRDPKTGSLLGTKKIIKM